MRQTCRIPGDDNMTRRCHWPWSLAAMLCGVPLFFGLPSTAHAEDDAALSARSGGFPELDSKYLFGSFTRGASVEDEGDRAIEPDTRANFGKRSGQYAGRTPNSNSNTPQRSFSRSRSVRQFPTTASVVYPASTTATRAFSMESAPLSDHCLSNAASRHSK